MRHAACPFTGQVSTCSSTRPTTRRMGSCLRPRFCWTQAREFHLRDHSPNRPLASSQLLELDGR
jgi:hypothetical protein